MNDKFKETKHKDHAYNFINYGWPCPYCRIEQLERELEQAHKLMADDMKVAQEERIKNVATHEHWYEKGRQDTAREIVDLCKKTMKTVITSNIGCGDYKHNCAKFNALKFDEIIKSKFGLEG